MAALVMLFSALVRSCPSSTKVRCPPPPRLRTARSIVNAFPLTVPRSTTRADLHASFTTSALVRPFPPPPSARASERPVSAHRGAITRVVLPLPLLSDAASSALRPTTSRRLRSASGYVVLSLKGPYPSILTESNTMFVLPRARAASPAGSCCSIASPSATACGSRPWASTYCWNSCRGAISSASCIRGAPAAGGTTTVTSTPASRRACTSVARLSRVSSAIVHFSLSPGFSPARAGLPAPTAE
mmetsp:Transcript_4898/g.14095  ORF Transcript_4898/g.14095 Transcript_4898/m.14095 type:complete len:244 (-) Transcript_4898:2061-2792(-)